MNRTHSTRTVLSLFCAVLVAVALVSATASGAAVASHEATALS